MALLTLGFPPPAAGAGSQLVFSTYLGGAFKYGDIGNDVAVDPAGNVYVTGRSYYSNFPVTLGAFQTTHRNLGPFDTTAFVAKFDPTGSRLIYATYLGGEGGETSGEGIAVDAAGDAYVSGYASSKNFPTTPGALRAGGTGGFVTKVNPAGSGLVYSTLLGDPTTHAGGIAVDAAGDAYVAAGTVTKLDPSGALVYSSSLGGHASAADVAVDPAGGAYVAGSASEGFQATPGAFQGNGAGAFAAKLEPSGQGFAYSTLLGIPKRGASAIAVDAAGDAYIAAGKTVKLNPAGALAYSSSLSGARAADVAVDATGDAFVTGANRSSRFRTTSGALERHRAPGRRRPNTPFVAELNPDGSGLAYATYLGGASDFASAVAVGPDGDPYVTGGTISGVLPTSPGAFQRKSHSREGYAAFATALDPSGQPVPGLSIETIERRGDRVRLRGRLDPGAEGTLEASARAGQRQRRMTLRRRSGTFVATAKLDRGPWTIVISFDGRGGWQGEGVCRRARLGPDRPRNWAPVRSRGCS
ncbi:MAG TPA: SBBP repeat-containing protein [Solirubrobacterales bacterium]|nr:SBBP repeat-containing protein [Solirubrobacterales bacterium]